MPTVNKNKQISGGALFSTDSDHILTTADQIYDEQRGCYVNEYDFSGNVKSVNGELPDQNGNINIEDKIRTVNGISPDSNKNVDLTSNTLITKDSKLETQIWNFTIENNSITLDGNGKNLFDSKSSNVFCNGTALNYIYILDNHINFVFENVLYNNNLYNFVIQIYKTGTYSILYKIPVKFYLNIISDDSWEVLDYNGEDITDLFIADMFNQTYPHSINPDRIQSDIIDDIINSVYTIDTQIIFNGFVDRYKVYRISLNTLNKTFTEDYVENLEMQSNKVTQITQENKDSTVLYPSVKAVADYVKDLIPEAKSIDINSFAEFIAAVKEVQKNTVGTKYIFNILAKIDFTGQTSNLYYDENKQIILYDANLKTYYFYGYLMYVTIKGGNSSACLKTQYISSSTTVDTVTFDCYYAYFENINVAGSGVENNNNGHYLAWTRPLFKAANNFNFYFYNCKLPILGFKKPNTITPAICPFITGYTSNSSHEGTSTGYFYHTKVSFNNCLFYSGRNSQGFSEGNLCNAYIQIDCSNNNSSAYNSSSKSRTIQCMANTKNIRYKDSGDYVEDDNPEIGVPVFNIKSSSSHEIWSVASDAHAKIIADYLHYKAIVFLNDIQFDKEAYTLATNTDYSLIKYIQDLENRIKTLETRLNTN